MYSCDVYLSSLPTGPVKMHFYVSLKDRVPVINMSPRSTTVYAGTSSAQCLTLSRVWLFQSGMLQTS